MDDNTTTVKEESADILISEVFNETKETELIACLNKPKEIDSEQPSKELISPNFAEVLEICLRNTKYDSLEELEKGTRADVLAWVRGIYPNEKIEDISCLQGSLSDYTLAMRQNEACQKCRSKGSFLHCSTEGKIYEVYPVPYSAPRQYYVGFKPCLFRRTGIQDKNRQQEAKEEKRTAPHGFGWGKDE